MNICHVNLARGFSGGESQTILLIKEHLRLGYSVTVVAKKDSAFALSCKAISVTLLETPHFLLNHSRHITQACDCIHVHEGQAIYWALIQNFLHKTPYLVTRRINNPFKNKRLSKLAYQKASSIVGVSSAIERAAKEQFPAANVCTIPDSPVAYKVDEDAALKLTERFHDRFLVIQAAKLEKPKGHAVTISAARVLEASHPSIQFCILGDGPEREQLERLAQGLSNIEFMGHQTDMGSWFAAADLLVLPSYREGMGSVLLEASLAGVPVIGTKAGGIPDAIKHETNGLLIEIGDSKGLAKAILRIKDDTQLRAKIKQETPDFIKDFDIQACAKRYTELYQSA